MTSPLKFVYARHEAGDTASFFFRPERPFAFQPGQYIGLTLPHPHPDSRGIARSFTIASAPAEPLLQVTTRLSTSPSTFKQALCSLSPDTLVEASGPHGHFVYTDSARPAVFIAGGIGITPFRAILGDLAGRQLQHAATSLLYSIASPEIPFRAFFDGLVADWPELRIAYTLTRPNTTWNGATGRIDGDFIRQHVDDLAHSLLFVCGPSGLVNAIVATLGQIGVDPARIRHEGFPGYETTLSPSAKGARLAVSTVRQLAEHG